MKNEIKKDLEELVSLIESEEDFAKLIDIAPIQNAINRIDRGMTSSSKE